MSCSTTTAAQPIDNEFELPRRANTDSLLPTHIRPQHAYTLPSASLHPYDNQSIRFVVLADSGVKRWFIYIVGIATIIGLVVAVVAVVVK
jgi:hypothetical protein